MKNIQQAVMNAPWDACPVAMGGDLILEGGAPRPLASSRAEAMLIRTLKNAYSGELGAINAYVGHSHSVSDPGEKEMIHRIEVEEICHRERVGEILAILGEAPAVHQEHTMGWIGKTLGHLCQYAGWFAPMYGAGFLESQNIREYEDAARFALAAGHVEFLDDLLTMAEVEWEHEKFFREKCRSHFLYHWFPKWGIPPVKEKIREPYDKIQYAEGPLNHRFHSQGLIR
jgi:rubrerythrin